MINLNKGVSTPIAITTIIVSAIVLVGGVLAYQYYYFPENEIEIPEIQVSGTEISETGIPKTENPKTEIPEDEAVSLIFTEIEGCIMGVDVDYSSGINVKNKEDVEIVFDMFISYSKENNREIFGYDPNNWRFENTAIHGLYESKKYWKVTASRFIDNPENKINYQKWIVKTVFDVSETGEVVRLLGCI
jgi:hypothetical protein